MTSLQLLSLDPMDYIPARLCFVLDRREILQRSLAVLKIGDVKTIEKPFIDATSRRGGRSNKDVSGPCPVPNC